MNLFLILKKIGRFAYKLDIFNNQKIYTVFSVTQLKLVATLIVDLFYCPWTHQLSFIFVEGNIDIFRLFKIYHLLNKRTVKKSKG